MRQIDIKSINYSAETRTILTVISVNCHPEVITTTVNDVAVPYITIDRIDAFVVALLPLAWNMKLDIRSVIPISEELYYNLENHFLDALKAANPDIYRVRIDAPIAPPLDKPRQNYVATAISCGVDSLYTIFTHHRGKVPDSFAVNALTFFNTGAAFKSNADEIHTPLVQGRLDLAKDFAKEAGMPLFFIESDVHHLIHKYISYSHVICNTYVNMACVLLMQKGLSKYYYSSSYPYHEFKINTQDCSAYYDLLTLNLLSINGLQISSTGGSKSRFDKQRALLDFPLSKRYLNVCVNSVCNCGRCFKCARTLLSIDALGQIDEYGEVFDIEYYKTHRLDYLERMWIDYKFHNDLWLVEAFPVFQSTLTTTFKIKCLWHIFKRKIMKLWH